jgi:hypothetical protein
MFPLTLEEVKERMTSWDEITLVEELGLTTEDIITAFSDRIENDIDRLSELVDLEEE